MKKQNFQHFFNIGKTIKLETWIAVFATGAIQISGLIGDAQHWISVIKKYFRPFLGYVVLYEKYAI